MGNTAYLAKQQVAKKHLPLLLLGVIFVLPLFVAIGFFYFAGDVEMQTKNHGLLLAPSIAIDSLQLHNRSGQKFPLQRIHTEWLLVYVTSTSCAQDCAENVLALEQIRRSLGKDYQRTGILLVLTNSIPKNALIAPDLLLADIPVAFLDRNDQKTLGETLSNSKKPILFLADVRQQLIMQYTGVVDQQAVYDDLHWLLKVNPIGLNKIMIIKPKNSGDQ
jgi:hypothetical protein